MTRIFPTHRLLQTPHGWLQHFHPSRVLQENLIHVGNGSATSLSILCQTVHHPRGIFNGGDNPIAYTFSLLMFDLILVTTITRIVRLLLKPLKQPKIISQIIVSFLFLSLFSIVIPSKHSNYSSKGT